MGWGRQKVCSVNREKLGENKVIRESRDFQIVLTSGFDLLSQRQLTIFILAD